MASFTVAITVFLNCGNSAGDFGYFAYIAFSSFITYGRIPELSLTKKVSKFVKGVGAIRAFKDLVWTTNKMKELNAIYAKYPKSPAEFPQFKKTVIATVNEAKARMPSAPV